MKLILFSMVLYLLGIVAILYARPEAMFHKDGRWREFGIGKADTTVVPFWMFCILWAVLSYGISRFIFSFGGRGESHVSHAAKAVVAATTAATVSPAVPTSEMTKPGYYRLNTKLMKKGIPRYIYVGSEVPDDFDESVTEAVST